MRYYFNSEDSLALYGNMNHPTMQFIKNESNNANWREKGGWLSFVKSQYNGNLCFFKGRPFYIDFENEADFVWFTIKIKI